MTDHRHSSTREPLNDVLAPLYKDQSGVCWWCGSVADSKEHKYKKTDLRRMDTEGGLVWTNDRGFTEIKSLRKSKEVLFGTVLCQRCNDTRSQPFDRAYDTYADFVSETLDRLWSADVIRLDQVYGDDWERQAKNLARYFGKHFGCLLADSGFAPPDTLRRFMSGDDSAPDLSICFVKDERLWLMHKALRAKMKKSQEESQGNLWLHISDSATRVDQNRLTGYSATTSLAYVGVKFRWHESWDEDCGIRDSFYWYQRAVLNVVRASKVERAELRKLRRG